MSAVCPACGVAVVPGYARCPRCQKPLPYGTGTRPRSAVAGGTVAEDRRFPWALVVVPLGAVVAIVLLLKLVAGGGDDAPAIADGNLAVAPVQPQAVAIAQPVEPTPRPVQPVQPDAPDPRVAISELERLLRSRRLWSKVEALPPRVDVRTSSCDDPAMRPSIDSVAAVLRRAGLTRLRCLAQSGSVVFERDL